MAQRALGHGRTRAAMLHAPGAYGEGMAAQFEAAFVAGGGTIAHLGAYVEGRESYSDTLDEVFATESRHDSPSRRTPSTRP